ncbi:uncharacterized protein LACBIDRAFT_318942 [Laccaria bicolor S238N-H82]|uniref:Predicted protein n=1 Tax=Laccaria bicolor (strain S238N-H82 / ATCC MYA-4686) TaxID=486041 RepID=B0D7H5_LACBS|nr:uncharacterized protein LACBIDRAFT_318942 [Laccaria bicolor S238N-H82]EDR09654.1 predicted protein [Laccaria bicolor S238N-H82]|eukprot:XP_001880003.1 predicted protein [Laccaria bicolor S238N-H82]
MAALLPPLNVAGVAVPPAPANPPVLTDITNALEYVERLSASKTANPAQLAINTEIGTAEAYKAAVISSAANIVPPWVANILAAINQLQVDINQIQAANIPAAINQLQADVNNLHVNMNNLQATTNNIQANMEKLPIWFANNHAGALSPLRDPTDQLLSFTSAQCDLSAAALGLPVFPHGMYVSEKRRLIALALGIVIV